MLIIFVQVLICDSIVELWGVISWLFEVHSKDPLNFSCPFLCFVAFFYKLKIIFCCNNVSTYWKTARGEPIKWWVSWQKLNTIWNSTPDPDALCTQYKILYWNNPTSLSQHLEANLIQNRIIPPSESAINQERIESQNQRLFFDSY